MASARRRLGPSTALPPAAVPTLPVCPAAQHTTPPCCPHTPVMLHNLQPGLQHVGAPPPLVRAAAAAGGAGRLRSAGGARRGVARASASAGRAAVGPSSSLNSSAPAGRLPWPRLLCEQRVKQVGLPRVILLRHDQAHMFEGPAALQVLGAPAGGARPGRGGAGRLGSWAAEVHAACHAPSSRHPRGHRTPCKLAAYRTAATSSSSPNI